MNLSIAFHFHWVWSTKNREIVQRSICFEKSYKCNHVVIMLINVCVRVSKSGSILFEIRMAVSVSIGWYKKINQEEKETSFNSVLVACIFVYWYVCRIQHPNILMKSIYLTVKKLTVFRNVSNDIEINNYRSFCWNFQFQKCV